MNNRLIGLFLSLIILPAALALNPGTSVAASKQVLVRIETNLGIIDLELNPEKAPATVKNFLSYVNRGDYDGTIFHRVISGFMIQGGGYDARLNKRPERKPVRNEADNGLKNFAGTIAMARTSEPHSASNQFFINTVDNAFLDHQNKSPRGWGYAVFGKVISGMDVIRKIESVATRAVGPFQNLPATTVSINKVRRIQP